MRMTVESGSVVAATASAAFSRATPTRAQKTYLTAFVLHFYYTHTHTHTRTHTKTHEYISVCGFYQRQSNRRAPSAAAAASATPATLSQLQPHLHPRNCFNWSRWCYLYKCLSFLFVRPVCISFFWQLKL